MSSPIQDYNKPTPVKWQQIGDAFLIISQSVTGYGIYEGNKTLALIALITGVVGRVIINFAKTPGQ